MFVAPSAAQEALYMDCLPFTTIYQSRRLTSQKTRLFQLKVSQISKSSRYIGTEMMIMFREISLLEFFNHLIYKWSTTFSVAGFVYVLR